MLLQTLPMYVWYYILLVLFFILLSIILFFSSFYGFARPLLHRWEGNIIRRKRWLFKPNQLKVTLC